MPRRMARVIEYRGLPAREWRGKFPRLTFWCVRFLQVDFPHATTDCRSIPLLRLHVTLLRSALDHFNIVRFVDCFEDEENIYMTLELCPMALL
jgi:serine/threonine protein kinase